MEYYLGIKEDEISATCLKLEHTMLSEKFRHRNTITTHSVEAEKLISKK
jgi:hypothetical protein